MCLPIAKGTNPKDGIDMPVVSGIRSDSVSSILNSTVKSWLELIQEMFLLIASKFNSTCK